MQNQFIVSQSFNNLELFHNSSNQQNIYNTGIFELRRCAVCRESAWFGLRDQNNQKCGKDDQLEQATATAADSCSSCARGHQKLVKRDRTQSQKIDNRSQQRNCPSICPMNEAQDAKPTCSHQRHE
ncbi:MAG TPA: hypothetical protein VFG30_15255 [Polyangiales bacterium]|nr:hypothetical protein [Polyangiales bacterium]